MAKTGKAFFPEFRPSFPGNDRNRPCFYPVAFSACPETTGKHLKILTSFPHHEKDLFEKNQ